MQSNGEQNILNHYQNAMGKNSIYIIRNDTMTNGTPQKRARYPSTKMNSEKFFLIIIEFWFMHFRAMHYNSTNIHIIKYAFIFIPFHSICLHQCYTFRVTTGGYP